MIRAFAQGAGHAIPPEEAETLAAAVERVAAHVLAAEAELVADPSTFAPAYLS